MLAIMSGRFRPIFPTASNESEHCTNQQVHTVINITRRKTMERNDNKQQALSTFAQVIPHN